MHIKGLDRWFAVSFRSHLLKAKLIPRLSIEHIPSSRPRGKQQPLTTSSFPLLHQRLNCPDHPKDQDKEIEFRGTPRGCMAQEDEEGVGRPVKLERVMEMGMEMGMGMGVGLVYRMRQWKSSWICKCI